MRIVGDERLRVDKWFHNGKFLADKIIVIGAPGSGKTFLSDRLEPYFDGAVFHIDQILWENETTRLSDEELRKKLDDIVKEKEWFIDRTYLRMLPERISKASLIFYLDLPNEECIRGINERRCSTNVIHGCEDYDGFIAYVSKYDKTNKPRLEELISNAKADLIVLKSREEVNEFLRGCANNNAESEE